MKMKKWMNGQGQELDFIPVENPVKGTGIYAEDLEHYQGVDLKGLVYIQVLDDYKIKAFYQDNKTCEYVMYELNKYAHCVDRDLMSIIKQYCFSWELLKETKEYADYLITNYENLKTKFRVIK